MSKKQKQLLERFQDFYELLFKTYSFVPIDLKQTLEEIKKYINSTEQEETMQNASKWVVMPHAILKDTRLSSTEKLIYGEISALEREDEPCYAGNSHFEDLFNLQKRSIQLSIAKLNKLGYIKISYDDKKSKHGRKITTDLCKTLRRGYERNLIDEDIQLEDKEKKYIKKRKSKTSIDSLTPEFIEDMKVRFGLVDVVEEIEKMKDWLRSRGRRPRDWRAQTRNWLRKAHKFQNPDVDEKGFMKTGYRKIT